MITYNIYKESKAIIHKYDIFYCGDSDFNPSDWEYCFTKEDDANKYAEENGLIVHKLKLMGIIYPDSIDENDKDFNTKLQNAKNKIESTLDYDFIIVKNKTGYNSNNLILAYKIVLLK